MHNAERALREYQQAWNELTAPGAQFAIDVVDVRGVPTKVFAAALPSMRAVWEIARGYGDRDYLVFEDERYTYAEADEIIRTFAARLIDDYGVRPGDRVAVAMRNYPEWVFAYWATVSVGAVVVGMNAWWASEEMEYALADARPKVLLADSERVDRAAPLLADLRAVAPLALIAVRHAGALPEGGRRWEDVLAVGGVPSGLPDVAIEPDDDACIFYTSGTTGMPKGAELTHRGSVHNLLNVAFMTAVARRATGRAAGNSASSVDPGGAPNTAQSVVMAPTPLFHVTAANCLLHPASLSGARLVLTYRWDPGRALELIERERVTAFSGVPTMTREMLAHPDWAERDTSSLLSMGGGGAPQPPDLVDKIAASLTSGTPRIGYGLTETSGIVTASSGAVYLAKPGSCGRLVPTLDARLVDASGNDVPSGQPGELCVRGAVVIKGYLNRPDATAEAIRDGWLHTGDIAYIDDDGFVFIVDRIKDLVLRGGENVSCSEVEAAIYALGGVAEVAVFGVPDERLGEIVGAAIVLSPGAELTEDELRQRLAGALASFKIPERVWFLDAPLPRSAVGKFLKRELKHRLLTE